MGYVRYREVLDRTSETLDWLDYPRELFAQELTFASNEHFERVPHLLLRVLGCPGDETYKL